MELYPAHFWSRDIHDQYLAKDKHRSSLRHAEHGARDHHFDARQVERMGMFVNRPVADEIGRRPITFEFGSNARITAPISSDTSS